MMIDSDVQLYQLKLKYNEMVEQYDSLYEEVVDLRDEKVDVVFGGNLQNLYKQQLKQALSAFQNQNVQSIESV